MRIPFLNALIFSCLGMVLMSCHVQKKNINYLNDKRDSSANVIWQNYDAKIQPGDKLAITISALNPASAQIYSLGKEGAPGTVTVDQSGNILYPQLGMIKAAGLTRNELRNILLEKLVVYLKDPIASVEFVNFKVTMLGEVERKGPITVSDGKITILEAIGQAGDVSEDGQRDSVLVIREVNGRREFGLINLLSNETFKSPYFMLQQNDVVYVPLLRKKALISEKEEKKINFQSVASAVSLITTIIVLILNIKRN